MMTTQYQIKKRLLALLIAVLMVMQMMPVDVIAEGWTNRAVSKSVRGVESYRVTWTVDGTTGSYVVTEEGVPLSDILPASPTKEGDYRFVGWVDNENNPVDPATVVTGDISVTAVFEEIDYKTVTFKVEGSDDITIRVENGKTIGSQMPADPSREGYRFDGWFSGETEVNSDTEVTDNFTVVAAFTELITVEFDPTTDPNEQLAHIFVTVGKGELLGGMVPTVPEKPGYTGKWVIKDTSTVVNEDTEVTTAFLAVPAYDKITYTVTFIQENGDEIRKTTDVEDGFAVNELPEVTPKSNQEGKWVYADTSTEFTVGTVVSEDTTVTAYYEQNVFTVTFMVDDTVHDEMTFYRGVNLELPTDPVKIGAEFKGWYLDPSDPKTKCDTSKVVEEDLTLYAVFAGLVRVNFIVKDNNGDVIADKSQYFVEVTTGSKVGMLPEDPFLAGKVFVKWADQDTGEEVTANTRVSQSIIAEAVFTDIGVYTIKLNYFYMNGSNRVDFQSQSYNILESQAENGYTITLPESSPVKLGSDADQHNDVYYPSQPTVTVTLDDFQQDADGNMVYEADIEYIAPDTTYKVGYYLKDLSGNGYSLIPANMISGENENPAEKQGVGGTKVTPEIKEFAFADFENRDEDVTIGDDGLILKVNYTRKNFTLSFNTDGGEYIEAKTEPYGTTITLPTTAVRSGYSFAGWQKDGSAVSGSITLEEDTVLQATWTPARVDYKIVYMIENANDDGYSYLGTVTRQETTGAYVQLNSQSANQNAPNDLDRTNFTFKESSREQIAADGTTVIIVKYSRNVYTITWEGSGYELNNQGYARE